MKYNNHSGNTSNNTNSSSNDRKNNSNINPDCGMNEIDTETPVVWPSWCYAGKYYNSRSFSLFILQMTGIYAMDMTRGAIWVKCKTRVKWTWYEHLSLRWFLFNQQCEKYEWYLCKIQRHKAAFRILFFGTRGTIEILSVFALRRNLEIIFFSAYDGIFSAYELKLFCLCVSGVEAFFAIWNRSVSLSL